MFKLHVQQRRCSFFHPLWSRTRVVCLSWPEDGPLKHDANALMAVPVPNQARASNRGSRVSTWLFFSQKCRRLDQPPETKTIMDAVWISICKLSLYHRASLLLTILNLSPSNHHTFSAGSSASSLSHLVVRLQAAPARHRPHPGPSALSTGPLHVRRRWRKWRHQRHSGPEWRSQRHLETSTAPHHQQR